MERHGELGEKILKKRLFLGSKLNLETYLKASQVSCAPTRGESVAGSYSCRWEISLREWWLFWLGLCECWFSFQEFCLWLILVRWFWLCLRLRWKAPFVSDILRPVSDPAESGLKISHSSGENWTQATATLVCGFESRLTTAGEGKKGAKDENKYQKYHFDSEILLRNMMHTVAGPHEEVGVFYWSVHILYNWMVPHFVLVYFSIFCISVFFHILF